MNSNHLRRMRWGVIVLVLFAVAFASFGIAQAVMLSEDVKPLGIGGDSGSHYNISYHVTEDPLEVIFTKVKVGNTIEKTMPDDPVREGYTFEGWYTEKVGGDPVTKDTKPTSDDVYYARWASTHYTILFDAQNGSAPTTESVKVGDPLGTLPTDPTYDGHSFLGWFTEAMAGSAVTTATVPTGDTTYYGHWLDDDPIPTSYTVTFNSNGGSAVLPQEVDSGDMATAPDDPTREGYLFVEWRLGSADGPEYDFTAPVESDLTLFAYWQLDESMPTTYTVTFHTMGGTAVPPQEVEEGDLATRPTDPTKEGFTFVAWHLVSEDGALYDFDTPVTSDLLLCAHWAPIEPEPATYTVSFNTGGGSAVPAQVVEDGDSATRPANPTRDGYTFVDWHLGSLAGTVYNFATPVSANITLFAEWEQDEPQPDVYHIQFHPQNGGLNIMRNIDAGDPLGTLPADPVWDGHTFLGWFTMTTGGTQITSATVPDGNTIYYAQWRLDEPLPTTHNVTFNSEGGSVVPAQDVEDGELATRPANPTREGYTFVAWRLGSLEGAVYDFATPVTSDITLYAEWQRVIPEPDTYTIQFDPRNGEANLQVQVDAGDALGTLPANPARADFSFLGWFTEPEAGTEINTATVPEGNTTYYAHWRAVTPAPTQFTVAFDSKGGSEVPSQIINEGGQAERPANPTKDGYTFVAWHKGAVDGPVYAFDTPVTASFTLFAEWRTTTPPAPDKVCVYFDTRGGTHVGKRVYEEGSKFGKLPTTKRRGYTFAGWYSKPGAKGAKITSSTVIEEDRVVYARWLSQNDRLRAITKTSGRWSVRFSPYKRTSKILVPCARPRTTIRFYKAQRDSKLYIKVGSGAWKRVNKITMTAKRYPINVYAKVIAQDGRHVRTYKVIVVDP